MSRRNSEFRLQRPITSDVVDFVACDAQIGQLTVSKTVESVTRAVVVPPFLVCKHQVHVFNPRIAYRRCGVVHLVKYRGFRKIVQRNICIGAMRYLHG